MKGERMFIAAIPVLGSIFSFLAEHIFELVGGVGTVLMAGVAYLARKYLVPYLELESRRKYAAYIAAIADDITDELTLRYPNRKWLEYLDDAVDKIIEICNIDQDVARRAIQAAAARK
jgi:hypothetical protein